MITDPVAREHLELGIAALESGEYEQGTSCLHYVEGETHLWCCMGVLTDVACKNGLTLERKMEDITLALRGATTRTVETFSTSMVTIADPFLLLPQVAQFYGLSQRNPVVTINGETRTMGDWNDRAHATFPMIARGIRETYLEREE